MPTEEIIVLANSRKWGGRCVAGISTTSGEWVRPVSRHAHGQLEPAESIVEGRQARLLDVVRIHYEERLSNPAQPENVLLGAVSWTLTGHLDAERAYPMLRSHLALGSILLGNRGGAVPDEVAQEGVEASLALVEARRPLQFVQAPPHTEGGHRRPRVRFQLGARSYELSLTDFSIRPLMSTLDCGTYSATDLGLAAGRRTLVTVSLGEPHEGWRSKLAAAVLLLP